VLVISDTQAPFEHPQYLEFLEFIQNKWKCNEWVHIGDEVDFHALSDWDSDPDGYSVGHELEAAVRSLKRLYKVFPKMKVCISNHTFRPFKRAFKSGLPRKMIKDYKEFLDAPDGWYWAEFWDIDNVIYEHGEAFSGKDAPHKAASGNMRSTVFGHLHSHAGIQYIQRPGNDLIFGMNVGCLIDDNAYAFRYNKKQKQRPILSCGVVIDGVPYLEPMKLNRAGKWVK
jgi:hypothetical protein